MSVQSRREAGGLEKIRKFQTGKGIEESVCGALQTVINAKYRFLQFTATSLAKTKGLQYQQLLADWQLRFEALKLKLQNPLYQHGMYAVDLFKEAAREAAALYKIQWSVEVESYATVAIEGLLTEIEEELRTVTSPVETSTSMH